MSMGFLLKLKMFESLILTKKKPNREIGLERIPETKFLKGTEETTVGKPACSARLSESDSLIDRRVKRLLTE